MACCIICFEQYISANGSGRLKGAVDGIIMIIFAVPKLILIALVVSQWHALWPYATSGWTALAIGFCTGWAFFVATKIASFFVMALYFLIVLFTQRHDEKLPVILKVSHAGMLVYGLYKLHSELKASDNMALLGFVAACAIGVVGLAIDRRKRGKIY